ncbi:unnamed protein product, partial [Ixodes persulcatus]
LLTLSLYEVSYLNNSSYFRTSNRCLLAVSCPFNVDVGKTLRSVLCRCLFLIFRIMFWRMLLLLAGDVEQNPGPNERLLVSASIGTAYRTGAIAAADSIASHAAMATTVECKMTGVEERVTCLEQRRPLSTDNVSGMSQDIAALKAAAYDAENRLRRNNLLFFGLPDNQSETWDQSEDAVLSMVTETMGIVIEKPNIERAHRIGRFQSNKNRPIVEKFCRFKDKETILA